MNARELARQTTRVGAIALPLALLGAGAVGLAWSFTATDLSRALADLARRTPGGLGPLIALLVVAAPLGAVHAGELAALRDGQQLAWLRASGHSVLRHVVVARVGAVALVAPLAGLLAAVALLGVFMLRQGVELAPLAGLEPATLPAGALRAGAGGIAIAAVACAVGLASRASVAETAARGAAASLATAALVGLALLASGSA